MTTEDLDALAEAALAADFDPAPWEETPDWRRIVLRQVAKTALSVSGLGGADQVRSAWTLAMTMLGWSWGPVVDEKTKRHPGIVMGELTKGGITHWNKVIAAVRDVARLRGLRITGE